jgi:gamma-glutamyltranspeptidase / glutathione hydrolase
VSAAVDRACRAEGGHLRREDFERYRVARRPALEVAYRGRRIWTNPPPASGGLLVAFGARALETLSAGADPDGAAEASRIATALAAMREARLGEGLEEGVDGASADRALAPETVAGYLALVSGHPPARRGTTHISVLDRAGNAASLSVSNGEGCGWVIPETGVMLNNMLGEADLQPRGFGLWPPDTRLTSMMAPTLVEDREGSRLVALGSGGSNRIRSAILQVLAGVLDLALPLEAAVGRPRLHVEGPRLEIEGGFDPDVVASLARGWPDHGIWPERNLFFGGVHAVERGPTGMRGAGDPRRGGVARVLP